MIDRVQLRELHGGDLPLHILEGDYVQALLLQELYRETEALVFKGGTFLKHVHGLDRFSEDLDFTRGEEADVEAALEAAANGLERYALSAALDEIEDRPDAILGTLQFEGPLFDGTPQSRGSIELDVSTRADILRAPEWRRLFAPYPEVRAVTARCLAIEEAFAEKLRALATRTRGRDLYDCWFLLNQDVPVEPELFEAKMAIVDAPPEVTISVSEAEWKRDLSVLLEHPPAFERVIDEVPGALLAAGLEVSGP